MVTGTTLTADLLLRAKAGDSRAFEELLAPVLNPGFRLAMVMLKDRPAAEDAVQEAALKAWRKLDRFKYGADLRPWFLAIVANQCRTTLRSRWRSVLPLDLSAWNPFSSEGRWADHLDLSAALDRLPRRQLLPITLYYHLDLPMEEVARVLGCSPGAAKIRVHRALQALRSSMATEVDL